MRIPLILMLSAALINITACSSISGNVVPQSGPSMEKVYDGMSKQKKNSEVIEDSISVNDDNKEGLKDFRDSQIKTKQISFNNPEFHKIPNPELHMYIYPHLSGQDQVPVPGYFTEFNVYEQNHYEVE